jgi:hypothetical protein
VFDTAVLSGRIHGLEDDEKCMPVRGEEQFLLGTQPGDVPIEEMFILLLGAVHGINPRQKALEINLCARLHAKFIGDFHHDLIKFPMRGEDFLSRRLVRLARAAALTWQATIMSNPYPTTVAVDRLNFLSPAESLPGPYCVFLSHLIFHSLNRARQSTRVKL